MGASVRKFVKPRAYYDIERRAIKHIEKEQERPTAAPKHKGTEQEDVYCKFNIFTRDDLCYLEFKAQ